MSSEYRSWLGASGSALLCTFIIFFGLQSSVECANILGVFTSSSPSHLIVHMSLVRALAEQGHNVTVVCSQKPKVSHEKINLILIPPSEEQIKMQDQIMSEIATKKNNIFTTIMNIFGSMHLLIDIQYDIMLDKRLTMLYKTDKFDLVIMGYFVNDYQIGVAAKFKCPVIVSWTGAPMEMVDELVGNPREVAYVPNLQTSVAKGERMGFLKRVQNTLASVFTKGLSLLLDYHMSGYYSKLFANETKFPTFAEMKKNVSLVFCNSHFSEGPIRPNVPAIVEIGGIQIKDKPNPLPEDIFKFLDSAGKTGAILFSLGSNLKSTNVRTETIDIIFKTLSALPQKVIWKWEDSTRTPGDAPNILYKKWLPQDDILAHPNIKLFITHAGKGGLSEALYHGVPMVALPVFADQNTNADKMVSNGYGQQASMLSLTVKDFTKCIKEVLNNPQYAHNVRQFSKLYRDRPLTARENVIFWTEYVLRHHGAGHMQSPLVHLNAIQSTNLDVIGFVCGLVYLVWRIIKLIFLFVCCKICRKSKKTNDKVKKQ